jgi:dihydrolipoamide dehydrogenase
MDQEMKNFDVVVLGGGPGGYPAAIRAAQSGKSVALIEAKELGGTCLNRGCIPSKTLIANAEVLQRIKESEEFGIVVGNLSFDYAKMVQRKNQIVNGLRKSLEGLILANKITLIQGFGKFSAPKIIKVSGKDSCLVKGEKIIIATGSEPRDMPAFPFDYKKIHNSTSLLDLEELPESLAIIGGGVIGCEFASVFSMLGVKVTILELMPRLLPMESPVVSSALTRAFKKNGIAMEMSVPVQSIDTTAKGVTVKIAGGRSIEADMVLVSVGRTLNTSAIGLEAAGIKTDENGLIPVNDKMETQVPGIYAIGDIASKWWLAHVASHQGLVAASNATGTTAHMSYNAVPSVIFTHPEIGTVGLSLEQATEQGYQATVGAFPFQALGKSQAAYQTEGFAQIVIDKRTGQILGAQVVGHEASTLIAEMAVAITNELTIESITETIHAHPTIAEAWLEAALIANNYPLHFPPKKIDLRSNPL